MSTAEVVLIVVGSYLVAASVIGLIPATLARSKGRSFAAWWAVSVLLLGIFTVIPVMLLPTYRCRSCREVMAPDAGVCWRCGTPVERADTVAPRVITPEEARQGFLVASIVVACVCIPALTLTMWAAAEALRTWAATGVCVGLFVFAVATAVAALWPGLTGAETAAPRVDTGV